MRARCVRAVLEQATVGWRGRPVYVACSMNFTAAYPVERVLAKCGAGAISAQVTLIQTTSALPKSVGGVGALDMQAEVILAVNMIRWFRIDCSDQLRGLPGFLSVLPLFAQLRTCILAVVFAAESAVESTVEFTASVAVSRLNDEWFAVFVFMKTNTPTCSEAINVPLNSTMEFELNMAVGGSETWYERDSHD